MDYENSSALETATGAQLAREIRRRFKRRILQDGLIGYVRLCAELLFGCRPETPEAAVDYCNRRPILLRQVRSEVLAWTRL